MANRSLLFLEILEFAPQTKLGLYGGIEGIQVSFAQGLNNHGGFVELKELAPWANSPWFVQ